MSREPVLTAGIIAGIIMAGLTAAVSLGWIRLDSGQMEAINNFILPLLGLVLPVIAAIIARRYVTPTAAGLSKTANGQPAVLVPESDATPTQMAAAQEASR